MLLTYQYRIKPSAEQEGVMLQTLELLRRHWNYALGQRLDWLNQTRCQIDRCSLVGCPVGDIPDKVDYYTQQSDLKQTKVLFPEYKTIWAEAQQVNLQRLNQAWERWRIPNASGRRAGRPRFKRPGKLRSFTYPRVNCPKAGAHLQTDKLKLSKIGEMPVVMHRPLPQGFELKTCTIVKQADGWYASFSLQDGTVPAPLSMDQLRTAIGIDVGLKEFLVTSTGQSVPIQQHYRKAQDRLARAQRFKDRKQPGSKNYSCAVNRVARLHQRVERVRREFHYHIAHWLCQTYDLIGIERLS